MSNDILENKSLNVIDINPFIYKIKIEKYGKIFEINYKPICKKCIKCDAIDLTGYEAKFISRKEVSAVINGSSNLTFSGMYHNLEVNNITIFHNESSYYEDYIGYFKSLWENFKPIEKIDVEDKKVVYKVNEKINCQR